MHEYHLDDIIGRIEKKKYMKTKLNVNHPRIGTDLQKSFNLNKTKFKSILLKWNVRFTYPFFLWKNSNPIPFDIRLPRGRNADEILRYISRF